MIRPKEKGIGYALEALLIPVGAHGSILVRTKPEPNHEYANILRYVPINQEPLMSIPKPDIVRVHRSSDRSMIYCKLLYSNSTDDTVLIEEGLMLRSFSGIQEDYEVIG